MSLDFSMFYDEEGEQLTRPRTATQEDLERVVSKGKPLEVLQKFAELVELGVQWDWFESYLQWQNDYTDWLELRDSFVPSEGIPEFKVEAPVEPVRPLPSNHLEPYNVGIFRMERQQLLDNAIVTISTGKSFHADEISKTRMSDAVKACELVGLTDSDLLPYGWSTADVPTGIMVEITLSELKEAFVASVLKMSEVWSIE